MVYFVYHFKQQMPLPTKKVDKQPWIKISEHFAAHSSTWQHGTNWC